MGRTRFRRYGRESLVRGVALISLMGLIGYFTLSGYTLFYQDQPAPGTHGPRFDQTPAAAPHETEVRLNAKRKSASPSPNTLPKPSPVNGLVYGYGITADQSIMGFDQAELDSYFAHLKELGVGWVRWTIDWSQVQPESADMHDWAAVDRVAKTSQAYSIHSLAVVAMTPSWARKSECSEHRWCPPLEAAAYARFTGEVAERYKDYGLNHFEIWNEPNYRNFWLPQPNVEEYKQLLDGAHAAIKASNPAAAVITGGLAMVGDSDGNVAPTAFVESLYGAAAESSFDGVAMHPYGYPALPTYPTWWNGWNHLKSIHDVMAKAGDGAKKVWITEYGAPTGGIGEARTTADLGNYQYDQDFMTESAQNDLLVDALHAYYDSRDWVGPFFWYSLLDRPNDQNSPEGYFGLMRADQSKKPSYHTLQNSINGH